MNARTKNLIGTLVLAGLIAAASLVLRGVTMEAA